MLKPDVKWLFVRHVLLFFFVFLALVLTRPGERSNSSFQTMAGFHRNLHPRVLERERTLGTRLFASLFLSYFLIKLLICPGGGEVGEGVLPYMGYIGVCRSEGYGFQAVYSRIGYINHSVWGLWYKVLFWLDCASDPSSFWKTATLG